MLMPKNKRHVDLVIYKILASFLKEGNSPSNKASILVLNKDTYRKRLNQSFKILFLRSYFLKTKIYYKNKINFFYLLGIST